MMASFKSDHISDELYFYKLLCTRNDFETDEVTNMNSMFKKAHKIGYLNFEFCFCILQEIYL